MANYKKDSEEYKKRYRPITVVNNEIKKNSTGTNTTSYDFLAAVDADMAKDKAAAKQRYEKPVGISQAAWNVEKKIAEREKNSIRTDSGTRNNSTVTNNSILNSERPAGVSQTEWNNERRVAEREKNSIRTDSGTRNNSTAANTERNTTTAMSNFRQLDNAQTQAVQDAATARDKAAAQGNTVGYSTPATDTRTAIGNRIAGVRNNTAYDFRAAQDAATARDKELAAYVGLESLPEENLSAMELAEQMGVHLPEMDGILSSSEEEIPPEMTAQYWNNREQIREWEENNGRNSLTSSGTGAITGTESATAPATTATLTAYENQNAQSAAPEKTGTEQNGDTWRTSEEKLNQMSPAEASSTRMWESLMTPYTEDHEVTNPEAQRYLDQTRNQVVYGNGTDDVTLLGTMIQIGLGLLGVDLPMDTRDLIYDLAHWESTPEHIRQTILDAVAFLPVVGALKYTDEAGLFLKNADDIFGAAGDIGKYGDDVAEVIEDVGKHGDDIADAAGEVAQDAGKYGDDIATAAGNVSAAAGSAGKIPWDSWQNYEKVTENGQEYAKVGDRLYSRHAVDRMQPSGNRFTVGDAIVQAGGVSGRSVAPQFVEDVLNSAKPVFQSATGNFIYTSGTIRIITNEYGYVVTIMTVG